MHAPRFDELKLCLASCPGACSHTATCTELLIIFCGVQRSGSIYRDPLVTARRVATYIYNFACKKAHDQLQGARALATAIAKKTKILNTKDIDPDPCMWRTLRKACKCMRASNLKNLTCNQI